MAIVQDLHGSSSASLEKLIVDKFGPDYALGRVLTLDQLGFADWPMNATEKIMKLDLRNAAVAYLNEEKKTATTHG